MKNDKNKNTPQIIAQKSYLHPYIFIFICPPGIFTMPSPALSCNTRLYTYTLYRYRPCFHLSMGKHVYILERCKDGCRTSLLIAGCSCSCHFSYFPTTLPSLHQHSFCRNDFSHLFHKFFGGSIGIIIIGSSYCIRPPIPLCMHCMIMHVHTWRHTSVFCKT